MEIADAGVLLTDTEFEKKVNAYHVVIPSYKKKPWKLAQYFIKIKGDYAIGDFNNALQSGSIIGVASKTKFPDTKW